MMSNRFMMQCFGGDGGDGDDEIRKSKNAYIHEERRWILL